jgi:hypothetical protein
VILQMTADSNEEKEQAAEVATAKFLEAVPPGETRQLTVNSFKFSPSNYPKFQWPQ